MLGRLSQQDLFEQYRKADVQIVPSVWEEPFGRIVIEAAQVWIADDREVTGAEFRKL